MRIVAFGGLAMSGKSMMATYLGERAFKMGYHVKPERFAGPLKDASALVGFHKGGDTNDLYREFCQFVGSKARAENSDWWTDMMATRLDVIAEEENNRLHLENFHETVVIIDDVRFMNEIELVRRYTGTLIFVDGYRRNIQSMGAAWRQHESEKLAMDYTEGKIADNTFHYTMSNNGGRDSAQSMAEQMAPVWLGEIASERTLNE